MAALQAPQGSNQLKTGSQQAKALPESTKGIAAVEGEIPIMMPAKLATNKVSPTLSVMQRSKRLFLRLWPARRKQTACVAMHAQSSFWRHLGLP